MARHTRTKGSNGQQQQNKPSSAPAAQKETFKPTPVQNVIRPQQPPQRIAPPPQHVAPAPYAAPMAQSLHARPVNSPSTISHTLQPQQPQQALNKSSKIGLGVGIGVVILLLIIILLFVLKKKGKLFH